MNAYRLAEILHAYKGEGATVHHDGSVNPYGTGYYIGGIFPPLVFDSVETVDRGEIAWWIGTHPANLYGVWTDDETGKVYVDATQWAITRRNAIEVGRERGELAVWDIRNNVEIRCQEGEVSEP